MPWVLYDRDHRHERVKEKVGNHGSLETTSLITY